MESKPPTYSVLKRRSDFERLFKAGYRVYPSKWMILSYSKRAGSPLRCGWTIPKKVGNAVIRNRLKRWCREFFKKEVGAKAMLFEYDINVVLRGNDSQFFKNISREDFIECLRLGWNKIVTR